MRRSDARANGDSLITKRPKYNHSDPSKGKPLQYSARHDCLSTPATSVGACIGGARRLKPIAGHLIVGSRNIHRESVCVSFLGEMILLLSFMGDDHRPN